MLKAGLIYSQTYSNRRDHTSKRHVLFIHQGQEDVK